MEFSGRPFREHTNIYDIMNDPAFDTSRRGKEKEHEEPDTCRICRGEATEQDLLYYPCKCSGSIKFVHQPCLVQWLAHSQKKHCELCKTPFHFTKVYDPEMPDSIPAFLFMKQLLVHTFRTVVTWLRWVLVAFVWLGWLPWSMRAIWRALFWLADGRWSSGDAVQQGFSEANTAHNASLGDATIATSSVEAGQSSAIGGLSQSMFGFSSGEPLLLMLMKKAFSTLFFPAMSSSFGSTDSSNVTTTPYKRRPSWLSDVKFLNSLTPSPTINNILIDTLEGQLITLLVVVSFILIFLIREWVVQQQPLDNIAEGEREAADQLIANNRPPRQAEAPVPEARQELPADGLPQTGNNDPVPEETAEERAPRLPRPTAELDPFNSGSSAFERPSDLSHLLGEGPVTPPIRRNYQENNGFNFNLPAAQPTPHTNPHWPARHTQLFRDLWLRASGDLEGMLKIVREEGREEELAWLVAAVTELLENDGSPRSRHHTQPFFGPSGSSSISNAETFAVDEAQPAFPGSVELPSQRRRSYADVLRADAPDLVPDTQSSMRFPAQSFDFRNTELNNRQQEPSSSHGQLADGAGERAAGLDIVPPDAESVDGGEPSSDTIQTGAEPHKGLAKSVVDWFWADVVPEDANQGAPPDEEAEMVEEPFVEPPLAHGGNNGNLLEFDGNPPDNPARFPELDADANDLDAIEEGDDLEGILELIGMQGPIFGLLQNAVFCALLISFTVAAGIWLPYLAGKLALVLFVNPVQFILGVPVAAVSILADVVLDTLIGSLGYVMYWTSLICKVLLTPFATLVPMSEWTKSITDVSLSIIDASSERLGSVIKTFFVFHEADVPMFSVLSHRALKIHEARVASLLRSFYILVKVILFDLPLRIASVDPANLFSFSFHTDNVNNVLAYTQGQMSNFANDLYIRMFPLNTDWHRSSVLEATNAAMEYNLAVWDTKDRTIAILMGYLLVSLAGLGYLRVARFISGTDRGQRVEGMIAEGLHQAGGVMKVILIIGIEMIVFPLYCGSLLDIALLPLFENATFASRIEFTSAYPLTSLFVHWFIGTCYMFHFALFVSMCRKIMRSGVLYFIRDPDDPTFHPVRDVLERNITTQLRKIAFSALVYGALVIVCLGGIVWGIYYGFDGVLPAHWSSKDPVLEFPIDLLFYNFGIPLAIKAFKPSDGLHSLYSWWFRKCARFLRLSDFFFGERRPDEEGNFNRHGWWGFLSGSKAGIQDQNSDGDGSMKRNGKFVRAPFSDQVRIPKGSPVFLEVTETNERVDGQPDTDTGLHGRQNDMFTKVYIPPFFRTRIAAFLVMIWMFAAATGVGTTVLPLVIGRRIMSSYVPGRPVNDVYAFSVGAAVVGAAACLVAACHACLVMMKGRFGSSLRSPREVLRGVADVLVRGTRVLYIITAFLVFLPSVFALGIELYLLIPIHTYLGNDQGHVIHFVQDWTLGVLYVQMAVKLAMWHTRSRPAAILNGIFHDGWLKPNVKLATRALLLPMALLATVAVSLPLSLGFVANSVMFSSQPDLQPKVYRYAYPVTWAMGLLVWLVYLAYRQVEIWKVSIRDEFFLIGERLHNFREKRAREVGAPPRLITG
ncbi:E3 ubiquitin-protein ligase SSM4 [Aspergillus lucknowensis]|uniref:RING-type E3 ubiquitin transferase n=1 Tax=Aspergillus lucknowensis TaxID=176173 RepID=A0ABR4M7M9_9EURO